ncbi:MAG: heavy-metal-associated domain-containing protein, partial [Candidatus Bathyarchaeota archaeon]|nr:heavy-metal-associated domain-containing protein [Candidatus Bathyarchaeota archaeon]
MTNKKKIIPIRGMHCASCAQTIEKALKETHGITEANVNLASEKAYVTYDSSIAGEDEVIAA